MPHFAPRSAAPRLDTGQSVHRRVTVGDAAPLPNLEDGPVRSVDGSADRNRRHIERVRRLKGDDFCFTVRVWGDQDGDYFAHQLPRSGWLDSTTGRVARNR